MIEQLFNNNITHFSVHAYDCHCAIAALKH